MFGWFLLTSMRGALPYGRLHGCKRSSKQPSTEVNPPVMVISEKDKEAYAEQGFLILRQAFTQTRIAALLEGIERLIDKGLRASAR